VCFFFFSMTKDLLILPVIVSVFEEIKRKIKYNYIVEATVEMKNFYKYRLSFNRALQVLYVLHI